MSNLVTTLATASAIGSGLLAGLFFAFSTAVMGGLAKEPTPAAIGVMKSINVVIVNPLFLLVFLGTPLLCAALGVASWRSDDPQRWWLIGGAALLIVGVIVVSFAVNIPLNDQLATADPASAHGAQVWDDYLTKWTAWNHVRTLTATSAAIILTVASRS